ncbi:hypothetical protein HE1_00546 [Holospora elegans E1]|uniref:Uncharacterized protein n=1 Tax=Holospora elegans E1 TaxID=1427503 RepID=A0A023DYY5_9PROT|nr:hypothetical protein [Holospora elegans]GAJ46220.1 hypothetical protein HE1_00546 [Holospora elegans E1]
MNVRIALKAVLFEGESGTNVKNVEKISRGVPEKDKLSLCFIRKRSFNEANCSAFGVSASAVLKRQTPYNQGYAPKLNPPQKTKLLSRKSMNFSLLKKRSKNIWIFKAWISKS